MIHLTLVTACIKRFPELIDNVSEVAKANVSQTDRVNLEALAFIACRLCHGKPSDQNLYTMQNKGTKLHFNRQRRKEGTFCASELAGIEPTPPAPKGAGYVLLDHSATASTQNMYYMQNII
jgi:hypothetical protein